MSGVATASRIPVDIRRLPWIKPLVVDYAFDHARVAAFFAGDPRDPRAWREAIARTRSHTRERNGIAEVIAAQQQRRGAPAEAFAAAARLRNPDTVAVVTGQQAGLFGGPLFTLLKALTAVQLAERLKTEHGVPAVAVFWIDAEDHDWDEVKSCGVLDASLARHAVTAGDPPGAHVEPVARLQLDATIDAAIHELTAALPQTEFTESLIASIRAAYVPGAGMVDAFEYDELSRDAHLLKFPLNTGSIRGIQVGVNRNDDRYCLLSWGCDDGTLTTSFAFRPLASREIRNWTLSPTASVRNPSILID